MNIRAKIDRVIDGDTVWVRTRVRLMTNAPEVGTKAGALAKANLKRLLPKGLAVQLVVQSVDEYGRIIAEVLEDDSGLGGAG